MLKKIKQALTLFKQKPKKGNNMSLAKKIGRNQKDEIEQYKIEINELLNFILSISFYYRDLTKENRPPTKKEAEDINKAIETVFDSYDVPKEELQRIYETTKKESKRL